MLRVYKTDSQKSLDQFISNSMSAPDWKGYMFAQPDAGRVTFPASFVVVDEPRVKLATIQLLK